MNQEQKMVLDFHRKFGVVQQNKPRPPDGKTRKLRIRLIKEEVVTELIPALRKKDLVDIADALADSLYVLYGTAVSYGIDLEPVFAEVHRSNMTKSFESDSGGKIQKGNEWSAPEIGRIINDQQIKEMALLD